jgi:hypothetical protein
MFVLSRFSEANDALPAISASKPIDRERPFFSLLYAECD